MPKPQKDLSFSVLLDYYGAALTDRQREIMTEYYNEDFSLAEIAENYGITRQGVRDAIKHGEAALLDLEARLGTARKETALLRDLERLQELVTDIRCYNDMLYSADPRIYRDTNEMLQILQRLLSQEDADGI